MLVGDAQQFPVQIVLAVSKKRFKSAVDRNLIKRRMREAYRLHKQQYLYDQLNIADKKIVLSLGYIGKEITPSDFTHKKMLKLLTQLSVEVAK
ncbi:ribonuclease P protein component [Mucilaginibacter frigoritolerans]|uniref:Ribonuclease P protein component n=2 Tax=Mucilaginibacter frigoritolerans TaxID=652788 RepID=A0A562TRQ8_9SPHI|nr:ribonuclease P protein component [Mucilaginibacter frigoritolerans]